MEGIKIVYIIGFWRSGGTLIGRILGCSDQVVFVGNIKDFWRKGLKLNRKCSCGEVFDSCTFWNNVSAEYARAFPNDNFEELRKEFKQIEKWSNFIKLKKIVFYKKENSLKPILDKYLKHNEKLYEIVSNCSGKKIIIDSSRNPGRLLAISLLEKTELYPINIIRDPRGVINSLINKDLSNYHEIRHNTILNLIHWDIKNYFNMSIMQKLNAAQIINVLYKNFTMYPLIVLEEIKKILNCNLDIEKQDGKLSMYLGPGHVFSGNRKRHESGKVTIKEDIDWKVELSLTHKILTSLISLPFFKYIVKKYGFDTSGLSVKSSHRVKVEKFLSFFIIMNFILN